MGLYEWLFGKKRKLRLTLFGFIRTNDSADSLPLEDQAVPGLLQSQYFRAITACRQWKCPKCGGVLGKGLLGNLIHPGENADAISGTATCMKCDAQFAQADVYAGMYDT